MSSNILITGAAGYIGGSVLADFLWSSNTLIRKEHITTAVRTEEQSKALSKLGIDVLRIDLGDENAVIEKVLQYNIDIVLHTASSLNPTLARNLITALGRQREITGRRPHFIHTSAMSAFFENTGWPNAVMRDTDSIFETEKRLAGSFDVRKTDVTVVEHAKAQGVASYIVVPPKVYGKGSGEWNKLSMVFPVYMQACITQKKVYAFSEDTKISAVHITDLTNVYLRITSKILLRETLLLGEEGFYFAVAHDIFWWEFLDHLAAALHTRSLVVDSKIQTWPSDEAAAEALGVPVQFVQVLWNSGENIISQNTYGIGWKPLWDKYRFLQNIDDEIQSVLELGGAKSSLIDSLFRFARKGDRRRTSDC